MQAQQFIVRQECVSYRFLRFNEKLAEILQEDRFIMFSRRLVHVYSPRNTLIRNRIVNNQLNTL